MIESIPHGHGLSYKKGVSDGILNTETNRNNIPNGHGLSYKKGVEEGLKLKNEINSKVK